MASATARDALISLGVGILYVALSSGLISFNKYLMHAERFPHASALMLVHMTSCTSLAVICYCVKPSLFTSLSNPEERVKLSTGGYLRKIVPVSLLFAVSIVASNMAYNYSGLAFLQIMKESHSVFVYTFSIMLGTEVFRGRQAAVLLCISLCTSLTVGLEIHFVLLGFLLQLVASVTESMKIALQGYLLQGMRLDSLTFLLMISPSCAMVLVFIQAFSHNQHAAILTDAHRMWPLLLLNGCLAFALNVCIAVGIKLASATSFILWGVLKDILIVTASAFVFHEPLSHLQCLGFSLQVAGVITYSVFRVHQATFDRLGVIKGAQELFVRIASPMAGQMVGGVKDVATYGSAGKSNGDEEA